MSNKNNFKEKTVDLEKKREKEKEIVGLMIEMYCKGKKHEIDGLCIECDNLLKYAHQRVDFCPFMETKTFCENCTIHCYKPDMKAQIKEVMRYSGPRMIFHHPTLAINHEIQSFKEKRRRKKEQAKK